MRGGTNENHGSMLRWRKRGPPHRSDQRFVSSGELLGGRSNNANPVTSESLQQEIKAAFPDSGVPPAVVKPSVHELTHPGVDAVRRAYEGRRWSQVDFAHNVEDIGDTLAFLTVEAYSYYLPAFLWWSLDQQFAGSYLCGSFMAQINPRNASQEIAEIYMTLSAQQQRLVALCLARCWSTSHQPAALSALEDFWDLFLTDTEKREVYSSPEAIRLNRRFSEIAASNKKRIR